MKTIRIQTAQNVDIEYPVAGIGERIMALIVDSLITGLYMAGIAYLFSRFQQIVNAESLWIYLIFFIPVLLYHLIFEIFMNGQSPGKKILAVKVIKLDGSQPSIGSYLLRWVLRTIDLTLSGGTVALTTYLLNGKGQRLGDIAAGTTVISLRRNSDIKDTILEDVPDNYKPKFLNARYLDERTISLIKEALLFHNKNKGSKKSKEILAKARSVVINKLKIHSILEDREFLELIIKDYNYLSTASLGMNDKKFE